MSDPAELEAGRYRATQMPDGALVITRATGTCDTCRQCGCGDQAPPVVLPAIITKAITGQPVSMQEVMTLGMQVPQLLKGLRDAGAIGPDPGAGEPAAEGRRRAGRSRRRVPAVGLPDQAGDSPSDRPGTTIAG